ncbi:MAG TPA: hypothetical protein VNS09_06305 [Solirubrobacter sp.]|nr:hypothetical protein [Solirubrobacter sp.]
MAGRISLLIDSPLRILMLAMQDLDKEVRTQIGKATKAEAAPIWEDELWKHGGRSTLEERLADSGKVGVTTRNVFLRAGTGKLHSGAPLERLAKAIEFGSNPDRLVKRVSRKGKSYTMRSGTRFLPRQRGGYMVYPAAMDTIPRFAALWIQTTVRAVHEAVEKAT